MSATNLLYLLTFSWGWENISRKENHRAIMHMLWSTLLSRCPMDLSYQKNRCDMWLRSYMMASLVLRPWPTETGIRESVVYAPFESGDGNCKNCTPLTSSTVKITSLTLYKYMTCMLDNCLCIPSFLVGGVASSQWSGCNWGYCWCRQVVDVCGQQSRGSRSLQVINIRASQYHWYSTMDSSKLQKLHHPEHRAPEGLLLYHWP